MNSQSIAAKAYAEPSSAATYAKVSLRLLPFLFLCYVCAYLNRINISFAKLTMMDDLAMSDTVYGLGASVFFIGYLMFEVPSNLILLKVGARRWIARIMVTWGIISTAMMFVHTPMQFYVLRFLLGVAEAGFIPAILLYLTYWFPEGRRSKVTAFFLAAIPTAGLIGAPLSGWIMHEFAGVFGWAGWQWLYLWEGVPTFAIGLVAFFYLDDKIEHAKWLTQEQKALISKDLADDAAAKGGHALHSIKDGLTNPRVLLLSFTYFFFTAGLYGVSFWLPTIIKATGVDDPLNLGLLTAIPYGAAVVAMLLVGRSSDSSGERRWHLALAGIIGACALAFSVMFAHNTLIAMIALTIGTMGVMTTISQFWVLPPAVLAGAAAAAGIAMANSIGSISGVVIPYMIGGIQTATGNTGYGVLSLSVCMIIGSLLVFANPAKLVNGRRKASADRSQ